MISFEEFISKRRNPTEDKSMIEENSNITNDLPIVENFNESIKDDIINFNKTLDEMEHINRELADEKVKETISESVNIEDLGYKIFRDKSESFICDMEITGANPSTSKARIIIESKDLTYMFEGTIDTTGKCKIPLKKMNFLEENERGVIKLEVIADDTVFTPWEDNFVAINSKKVSVKVFESSEDSSKIGVRIKSIR
jgi:hypothetical protein